MAPFSEKNAGNLSKKSQKFPRKFLKNLLGFSKKPENFLKKSENYRRKLPAFSAPPSPARPPSHLGAASGPDRTSKCMRNNVSANEQDGAAERSEAAYVAPSPLGRSSKGDGAT